MSDVLAASEVHGRRLPGIGAELYQPPEAPRRQSLSKNGNEGIRRVPARRASVSAGKGRLAGSPKKAGQVGRSLDPGSLSTPSRPTARARRAGWPISRSTSGASACRSCGVFASPEPRAPRSAAGACPSQRRSARASSATRSPRAAQRPVPRQSLYLPPSSRLWRCESRNHPGSQQEPRCSGSAADMPKTDNDSGATGRDGGFRLRDCPEIGGMRT
jgi:hypothetical protein